MTEWASLQGTYGSAEQIPGLLAAAADAEDGEVWDELWTHLCHQGTVYSASYAALPALARMSRDREPAGRSAPLHLAASIVAATDGPEDPVDVRRRYEREIAELHAVATHNLPYATTDVDLLYGLEALMAFENGGVWQRDLHRLADDEVEVDCPSCDEHLVLDVTGPVFRMESIADGSLPPTLMTPVDHLATTIEGRLLDLTRAHGREPLSARMQRFFGRATCPACHALFHLAQPFP
ncbi:hypothetical protein [Actinoplanes couchii]|uniref:Uncharacterized protein n=1 Tax=Actinoplanes couchii TaxID=403638 RepID=A0ABQ3XK74_9ACTN|nr:hypothetical protein [Actinoplanes couchii]MDR6320478.1 hypothetical protein [Actinoplanes couchii]GID58882.1 hypothetical protein Aco03nite_072860 [Actinoplanes couchii]